MRVCQSHLKVERLGLKYLCRRYKTTQNGQYLDIEGGIHSALAIGCAKCNMHPLNTILAAAM